MIVYDYNILGPELAPTKTNSPFAVDANTALAFSITLQDFEVVPWRLPKIVKGYVRFKTTKAAFGGSLKGAKLFIAFAFFKELFRFLTVEGLDHDPLKGILPSRHAKLK